jgi:hypothetical protein
MSKWFHGSKPVLYIIFVLKKGSTIFLHIQKEGTVLILKALKLLIWREYPFYREFLYRREFLTIFRKARAGELELESGLGQLASLSEINVDEVGVGGAKDFFEAKVSTFGGQG